MPKKMKYSEPTSFFPKDIEKKVWGNKQNTSTTKRSTKSATKKKKK